MTSVRSAILRRSHHLPTWLRFSRYTVGSAICFGVSELVLVILFGLHLFGARGASVIASIAGVIPGYFLNRTWTWGRRGRSDFWREVVPYWATAIVSTLVAALGTGAANAAFMNESRGARTLINAAAYMLIYAVLFVAKYVIFQKWLFTPPPASPDVVEAQSRAMGARPVTVEDPGATALDDLDTPERL